MPGSTEQVPEDVYGVRQGIGRGCGDARVGSEDVRGACACGEKEWELMVLGPGTGDLRVIGDPKFYYEA